MLDNNLFDPEKVSIIDYKLIKGQVNTPEDFDDSKIADYKLENSLQLAFNLEEKLAKADFMIEIITDSKGANIQEANGIFHLIYFYKIENLNFLSSLDKNNMVELDPALASALSALTYSTSRGILLTRMQGTALQSFILPVIDPTKLLQK